MLKILCQKRNLLGVDYLNSGFRSNSDYSSDGKVIFCQPCGKQIKCFKKFQSTQHSNMSSHIAATKTTT